MKIINNDKWVSLTVIFMLVLVPFLASTFPRQSVQLTVNIVDSDGMPTPVRVRITNSNGVIPTLPEAAIGIMYGFWDGAEGYAFQPDSAFYVDGSFSIDLQPGTYQITLSKGIEYLKQQHEIILKAGKNVSREFKLERWINMPSKGWYSGDDHIHIRRSPRENPYLAKWIAAEDIHVGSILQMGDFWATYYTQYAWGKEGTYQAGQNLLTSGQEDPRTHEIGHTILLGADSMVRFKDSYYLYDKTFDHTHELDGLTGYAHQGMSFNGSRGMTMDVLQGKVDFMELLQFCVEDGPIHLDNYYRFLDMGFKLTATAGSDFPWCGNLNGGQIGNARYYTYVEDEFKYENWKASLKAGHTFVSNGPMLDLRVNGKLPGEDLDLEPGSMISITVTANGNEKQVPLTSLEIVAHGEVIGSVNADDPGQSANKLYINMEMQVTHGIWIAARSNAGVNQKAHTTPIYITLNGDGFFNPATLQHYIDLSEQYLHELEIEISQQNPVVNFNAWRYKGELEARIAQTRTILKRLELKLK